MDRSKPLVSLTVQANQEKPDKNQLSEKTLREILREGVNTFFEIIEELLNVRSPQDLFIIIFKNNRLFYLGMYVVALAIFLLIVTI